MPEVRLTERTTHMTYADPAKRMQPGGYTEVYELEDLSGVRRWFVSRDCRWGITRTPFGVGSEGRREALHNAIESANAAEAYDLAHPPGSPSPPRTG